MQIKYGKQVDIEDCKSKEIDLFLLAGNHEKRVFTAFDKVNEEAKILNAIILCYKTFNCDKKYADLTKKIVSAYTDIFMLLDDFFFNNEKKDVNIFIDYSCMTKSWYYSIILYISNKKITSHNISTYFSYTPSKYSTPRLPKPNFEIAPLPGKYVIPTDKPKALIVCLGYEQNKAQGIIEHLDPKIACLFYTKPALDPRFVKTLEDNNKSLIEEKALNVVTFPFNDLLFLERELTSLYFLLRDEYSIIIAPLGPKPFTFISMLMSVKYGDIDIWRVGSGSDINEYPREPIPNTFIISKIKWQLL